MSAYKPLEIKEDLHSTVTGVEAEVSMESLESLCREEKLSGQSTAVVWAMQTVSFGLWDGTHLTLEREDILPEDMEKIRIFNEDEELLLIREEEGFRGRHILDEAGKGTYAVDSASPLWGERVEAEGLPEGFVCLQDAARGITLRLPYEGPGKRLLLVTRSYIRSDAKTGLSGYGDVRYLRIVAKEERE